MALLEIKNLSLAIAGFPILRDIDLSVDEPLHGFGADTRLDREVSAELLGQLELCRAASDRDDARAQVLSDLDRVASDATGSDHGKSLARLELRDSRQGVKWGG